MNDGNDIAGSGPGGLPPAVKGALWMLLGGLCYALTGALVRIVSDGYSMFEVVFIRSVIALAIMAPLIARLGVGALRTRQPGKHLLRAAIGYGGILCWFYGVGQIPLANYYALQFTMPLFTIALAVLVLRERAGVGTWIAVAIGLGGALVILRPGLIAVSLGGLAAIAAAMSFAVVNIFNRVLSRSDDAAVIVLYANLLVIPMSLVPALFDWVTPAWSDMPALLGIGVLGTLAQFSLTRAVSVAEARVVQPFDFGRLPFAAVVGWFAFGEALDLWTWIGALIIFSAGYYALSLEPGRKRSA